MITEEVKKYLEESVLCWLATSNPDNIPNVSPKEMFVYQDDHTILIANIASPNSIANIESNAQVCVSFINVLIQKGFKMNGRAKIIQPTDADFTSRKTLLTNRYSDLFPIQSIIEVAIESIDQIIAPSYFLFPDTTEESQISSAKKTYKLD